MIDTPGLGCEEEENSDGKIAREIARMLNTNNTIGGQINAFIIVLKSGQSRWAGQEESKQIFSNLTACSFTFIYLYFTRSHIGNIFTEKNKQN